MTGAFVFGPLLANQRGLGRAKSFSAVLIPIRKTVEWRNFP